MELVSMRKNCMGTMDFTLKIGKMKKAEEFCTYPIQKGEKGDILSLQSHHRWARLNTTTGEVEMSARRNQYADSIWFMMCKIKGTMETDKATPDQLEMMLSAVRGTASPMAGNNAFHVYCDNSNANLVGKSE